MNEPTFQFDRVLYILHYRRYRRRTVIIVTALLIVLGVTALVNLDLYRIKHQAESKQYGATYQQTVSGPHITKSDYFQFADSSAWKFDARDSTTTKFSYLLFEGGLPAHSVTIYVNQTPNQDDLATTRVLPVKIKDTSSFTIMSDISSTCGGLYKPTDLKRIKLIQLDGTTMMCVPDSPQYTVVVGQVGKDYNLSLQRLNGQFASYIIIYHNLTVSPDPAPFIRIMKTFQAV